MPNTSSFSSSLIKWYNKNARDLPWRETRDPYKIWISEIMLQQTTVSAVIPYYNRWIEQFPTVERVAKADEQTVLKNWQGLGYYSRAKNILKSAKIIVDDYKGQVPTTKEQLLKLPGLGAYTVGAVLSIAFDRREPIIDANVRRVIMRIAAIEGLANASQDKKILPILDQIMPKKNLRTFNQALMELGAMICKSKEPLCTICPVRSHCQAAAKGIQEIIPQVKKKQLKTLKVAIGVIFHDGKYYIQKRSEKGLFGGLWEFPGGKIENGETAKEAVVRELKEETQMDVSQADHYLDLIHYFTQFRAELTVFRCSIIKRTKPDIPHHWLKFKDLSKYPMPSGSARILEKLGAL